MMKLSQSEKMRLERRLKGAMDAATAGVGVIVKIGRKLMSANVRRTEEESITPIAEKHLQGVSYRIVSLILSAARLVANMIVSGLSIHIYFALPSHF